jgi:outer membrane biogenesis lipoprotein LolB
MATRTRSRCDAFLFSFWFATCRNYCDTASLDGDAVEQAASFAALTRSQLGVAIDARLLARWVQGVELDKAQRLALSGTGKADEAREWTIKTENIQTLPGASRFRYAARLTATDGETTLRLVVDQFSPQ